MHKLMCMLSESLAVALITKSIKQIERLQLSVTHVFLLGGKHRGLCLHPQVHLVLRRCFAPVFIDEVKHLLTLSAPNRFVHTLKESEVRLSAEGSFHESKGPQAVGFARQHTTA